MGSRATDPQWFLIPGALEPDAAPDPPDPYDHRGRPNSEKPGWWRQLDPQYEKVMRRTSRGRGAEFWWDDALLTLIVLIAAAQDLAFGVWRVIEPTDYLNTVNNVTNGALDDSTLRLTRVGAFNQLESGVVGILLVAYRMLRWYSGQPFNGVNFQLVFLINMLGKTGAFIMNEILLDWPQFFLADGPLDRYVLLSRAVLATLALGLSIRTYWHSWHWL